MTNVQLFVDSVTTASDSRTPYTRTEVALVLRLIAEWSSARGCELTTESVLSRNNIITFINEGLRDRAAATRADYRSKLLRVAEAMLSPDLAPRRLDSLPASDPSAPYSTDDQAALLVWSRRGPKSRRDDARVLLALGLGAGLSAQEIMQVRASDVITSTSGLLCVRVRDGRRRMVPVMRKWEKALASRASMLTGEDFVFIPGRMGCGKNLISNFVARGDCEVHVQTQRLRSTWLVAQMTACSPLPALIEAAGVDSLEALTRFLPFVAKLDADESAKLLRAA